MRQKVTEQKKATLKRYRAQGLSYRRIARETGLSPEAVMYHLSKRYRASRRRYERKEYRKAQRDRWQKEHAMHSEHTDFEQRKDCPTTINIRDVIAGE